MSNLYIKHNYLNKNIKYIKNAIIKEYDMKNGGLSILYNKNFITKKKYEYYLSLDKNKRNIEIGLWLKKNKEANKGLMEGFKEARQLFFEVNEITDKDVLSIKKDAIFLIDKEIKVEQVNDNYLFRNKNDYSSYINLNGKEFYYSIMDDILDVKGFQEEVVNIQKDYLFKFIKECLKLDADGNQEKLLIKLLEFKDDFLSKSLDYHYYYDINYNGYIFNMDNSFLSMKDINEDILKNDYLIMNNNLNIIIELISNIY